MEVGDSAASLVGSLFGGGEVLLFLSCLVDEGRGVFLPYARLATVGNALGWVLDCFFRGG